MPYFLVTLTVPQQLREPIRAAQPEWYGALLKEGAGALQDLAAQTKPLGAELGVTAMLQSWTRDLRYHPHVHLLVPGGGLTRDGLRWLRVKDAQFFLPAAKLAARFKGRLKAWLKAEQPELLARLPARVWWVKWVADIQAVGSGEAALKYLAAYLCRPPLHESQVERWDSQKVTFGYRDNGGAQQRCTLSAQEFVRRVLQHVLPKSFQRVRHYGWLGAAAQRKRERIAALLDWRVPTLVAPAPVATPVCPGCGKTMVLIAQLARKPP